MKSFPKSGKKSENSQRRIMMSAVKLCLFIFGDQDAFCQCEADLWVQFLIFSIFITVIERFVC